MATVINVIPNKLHPVTGENLYPTVVTTWVDGTTPMTDALCGGLYNKDTAAGSPTLGQYFRWNFSGPYSLKRLTTLSEFNFMKLVADFGTSSGTLVIDRMVPITVNRAIPPNITLMFEEGGGFNISNGMKLTINGYVVPPNSQIFFGEGTITPNRFSFPFGLNPVWFGAKGDSINDDGPAIQKTLTAAATPKMVVELGIGTFKSSVGLSVPQGVTFRGQGWLSTYIQATTAVDLITTTSTSTVEDMFLHGSLLGARGLVLGNGNRTSIYRLKIEKFVQYGVHCLVLNNSQIEEVMVQYCGVANFRLSGSLNCSFNSCNSNSDELIIGGQATRSVIIDYARNCRFNYGIYERGTNDYQIEVISCDDVEFANLEVNNGAIACAVVRSGDVSFNHVEFSTPANAVNVLAITGGIADIKDCQTTGTNGRGNPQLYKGNILFNGSSEMPIMSTKQGGSFSGSSISGAVITWDEVKNNILVSTVGSTAQGVGYGLSQQMLSGQVMRVKIIVKAMSTGKPCHLYHAAFSGSRNFIGELESGYNEWLLPSDGTRSTRIEILDGENVDKTFEVSLIELSLVSSDNSADATILPKRVLYDRNLKSNAFAIGYKMQTLANGATITWNWDLGTMAEVTLPANRVLSITNPVAGATARLRVIQDATGGRTLTLPAGSKVANNGIGAVTLTTAPGSIDMLMVYYDGTNYYWTFTGNYTGITT